MKLYDPQRPKINNTVAYCDSTGRPIAPWNGLTLSHSETRSGMVWVSCWLKVEPASFSSKHTLISYMDLPGLLLQLEADLEGTLASQFGYFPGDKIWPTRGPSASRLSPTSLLAPPSLADLGL